MQIFNANSEGLHKIQRCTCGQFQFICGLFCLERNMSKWCVFVFVLLSYTITIIKPFFFSFGIVKPSCLTAFE